MRNCYAEVLRAAAFAAERHRNQRRKDALASPYINHPLQLADLLANEGRVDDPEVLCAALLHDTVEDTETSLDEIRVLFGEKIADIVREVTDDKSLPKPVRKQLQIEHARSVSREAKLVKLADKICNLRDLIISPPPSWTLERRQEYFEWAARVVAEIRGVNTGLERMFDQIYQQWGER